ncbi:hypothetical protein SAMN02745245_01354 [Anaerosphaera aminiphila DSM 21120]|uniref:DUF4367 domain-containing protein n=1 Tax=Anaerosphaera aminiphila DSM 21120 TaxID=1120995 RepID=A0A1M5T1Z0_9FIRM|nr:hypothetical protein [Anaerosphaera aminiphila]SHH44692.1 hypothetical protein SAMN02745245_01354 [Anaerosphaera aminiphila DSM 21120]
MNNKNSKIDEMLYNLVDSGESNKNKVYENIMSKTTKKKRRYFKPIVVTFTLVLLLTTTGLAKDIYNYVTYSELPSGTNVSQYDTSSFFENIPIPIPKSLKGKVFDEDGNEITWLTANQANEITLYTKEGEPIGDMDEETGEVLSEEEVDAKIKKITLEEAIPNLNFNPLVLNNKYTLEYVTDSYQSGNPEAGDYFSILYSGPKGKISIGERRSIPETQISYGIPGPIIEKTIDGTKLTIYENSLDFERDGILVFVTCKDATPEELIEIYKDFIPYEK